MLLLPHVGPAVQPDWQRESLSLVEVEGERGGEDVLEGRGIPRRVVL